MVILPAVCHRKCPTTAWISCATCRASSKRSPAPSCGWTRGRRRSSCSTGETRTSTTTYPGSRRTTPWASHPLFFFCHHQVKSLLCGWKANVCVLFLVLLSWKALMRDLEEKEKELNKLKTKADGLLNNNHPASDKIQVRRFSFFLMFAFHHRQVVQCVRCSSIGLHGHFADTVELAAPNHQVHPRSLEGKCCLQPGKCCSGCRLSKKRHSHV